MKHTIQTNTNMNKRRLILSFALVLVVAAICLPVSSSGAPEQAEAAKDIYPRWSVTGEWRATHPFWADVLIVRDDGTFHTERYGMAGRWTLSAEAGTPLLILRWDRWGTESLLMIGPDHFRGQIESGKFMDMRRGEEHAKAKTSGTE
jgi:hypothetical protein